VEKSAGSAMMHALLLAIVCGTVLLAITVDLAAIVEWLRRRWR
jgi:hypothetical protein